MKNLILAPVVALLLLIPGDTTGFPRGGGGGARPAPSPAVAHTPSFSAPAARPNPAPAARPNYTPAARPNPAPAARPATQPAFVPKPSTLPARPANNVVSRPNINTGNTVNAGNRTNIGVGNRPNINTGNINAGNKPIVGSGNTVNVNRPVSISNQNQVNRHINANYPNGGMYRPGYAYYHGYHDGWHHGYWNTWNYRPWLWGGVGLATGLVLGAGGSGSGIVYADPYYDVPVASVDPVFDYSQPIPVPEQVPIVDAPPEGDPNAAAQVAQVAQVAQPPTAPVDDNSAAAEKLLEAARDAFMKKDYDNAQQGIDKAIALLPGDTTLHEFRSLVLFARQQYREAAAVIHAVLAVGPGWDWDTLKTLYPDTQTYTDQLRALENYCKANPMAASARFLLAYHYLILDSRDAAVKMLKSVVALLPSDDLAVYLLKSLDPKSEPDRPTPGM